MSGNFKFMEDCTYESTFGNGVWKIVNCTLYFESQQKVFYTVQFNHDASEGILIKPFRTPQSKLVKSNYDCNISQQRRSKHLK